MHITVIDIHNDSTESFVSRMLYKTFLKISIKTETTPPVKKKKKKFKESSLLLLKVVVYNAASLSSIVQWNFRDKFGLLSAVNICLYISEY